MGYAFDYGIMEIPYEEALAIAIMNAKIRDNMLTPQEEDAKLSVKKPQYVCVLFTNAYDPYFYGVYTDEDAAIKDFQNNYHEIYGRYLDDAQLQRLGLEFEMVLVKD